MGLQLRPYQQKAVDDLYNYFCEKSGNPLVVIPTGGGKSLIMAEWCRLVFEADFKSRILVVTHVSELVQQNHDEILNIWPDAPCGIYAAKLKRREMQSRLLFASIQSIYKHAYKVQQCDMILIDESHLIPRKSDTMYRKFLDDLLTINPKMKVIGFTATPFRVDSGLLHRGDGALFTDMAHETSVKHLIDEGYLSRPVSPKDASCGFQIDTTGIKTVGGDFAIGQLEVPAMDPEAVRQVCDSICRFGQSRKGWIVFGVSIAHCKMIEEELRARGVSVAGVYGETENRSDLIESFKRQELKCLVSQGVLTTGFNARHVDMIALVRPTKSTGLYIQMVGRGTRLSPETGKEDCLILDFGGNVARHGPFDDPNIPDDKGPSKKTGEPLVKYCPDCESDNPIAAGICNNCGYEFPASERKVFDAPEMASIMSEPPKWIDVDRVDYRLHEKLGKPTSLKVIYQNGLTHYNDWLCFGHSGFPRARAERWWRKYAGGTVPATAKDAIGRVDEIKRIAAIQVKKSGKYHSVVAERIAE